jgi:hypothetical protein
MTRVRLSDVQLGEQVVDDVNAGPHEELSRLEQRIEKLEASIESCRKFILASRVTVAGGGVALVGMFFSAIRFDLGPMAAAVAAFLGGIAVWGSNRSTSNEAVKELTAAKEEWGMLIEMINSV